MVFAGVMFVVGGLVWLLGRTDGGLLPGDLVIKRGNSTFVFPIVTSIVVSIVLTVLLNLFLRK